MGSCVDELVILGEHVTLIQVLVSSILLPGFGEDDYNVGIANGLEVAVTVNERGIMMENAGLTLQVSSMTRLFQLLSKNLVICSLLKKKSLTPTHLTGGRKTNHLACSSTVVCLCIKIPSRYLGRN